MVELEWKLKSLQNGFVVDGELFFEKMEDAISEIKKRIDIECKGEFGE